MINIFWERYKYSWPGFNSLDPTALLCVKCWWQYWSLSRAFYTHGVSRSVEWSPGEIPQIGMLMECEVSLRFNIPFSCHWIKSKISSFCSYWKQNAYMANIHVDEVIMHFIKQCYFYTYRIFFNLNFSCFDLTRT